MPRRARSTQRASYFHVINRSARRLVLFAQPADYRAFLSILSQALEQHPVRLIAYSLMPNHWHLVMGPTDTTALSKCLHWVTATHAVRHHRHRHSVGEGPVYQGRFTSMEIPAVGDLVRVCRYVERNALQAKLVRRAQDWPWASLSERLHPAHDLPLVNTPFLSSRAWADYVNTTRPGDDAGHQLLTRIEPLDDFAEAPSRFA
ncbi:MAG TPA: transposase [Vicinamibacterales bacterium]|jgi:putative transposase|nr:transposase [Acidobacteriota bacterium]HQX81751.1 transposase [Vicinamibacterales bacterium]